MEAIGTMEVALCKVVPDPIFFYPIPKVTYAATAKFSVTNVAREKIAYKIRFVESSTFKCSRYFHLIIMTENVSKIR